MRLIRVALPFLMIVVCVPSVTGDDKEEAKLHYQVALIALQAGDLQGAGEELDLALAKDPNNALIHYNLAKVRKTIDPAKALVHLTRASELGLSESDQKAAALLKVEIAYHARRTHRLFLGNWVWEKEGSLPNARVGRTIHTTTMYRLNLEPSDASACYTGKYTMVITWDHPSYSPPPGSKADARFCPDSGEITLAFAPESLDGKLFVEARTQTLRLRRKSDNEIAIVGPDGEITLRRE